jgi:hypothetical protein
MAGCALPAPSFSGVSIASDDALFGEMLARRGGRQRLQLAAAERHEAAASGRSRRQGAEPEARA